jgi:hypothetical protein
MSSKLREARMKENRFYCRPSLRNRAPHTIPTQQGGFRLWPVLGTLGGLAIIVLGGVLDDADRMKQQQATQRRQAELRDQWEQGRQEGHREAVQMQLAKLRDTYAGGVAEGLDRCPGAAK